MESVVGIFQSRTAADEAVRQIKAIGVGEEGITLLRPGTPDEQVESSTTISDTESPGMGQAMGGAVGGALGVAGGASLGLAVASLFIPGVGPILVAGALGAALLGSGGVVAGMAAGEALEEGLTKGLPHDELFVYEHALRHGHSVVIVSVNNADTAERVRHVLERAGAESIDAARESWWLGVRDAEQVEYERNGGSFLQDETSYRRGFEAALHPSMRRRSFDDAASELRERHQGTSAERPFRAGYERGQALQRSWEKEQGRATGLK
ncbi:MAG: hypothetical protein JWM21_2739 [Acidobacteria bacterium]|nr:hypothetical protein [Acidobacteriota bacterium]